MFNIFKKKPPNISEPVHTILTAMQDVSRWEMQGNFETYAFKDTITNQTFVVNVNVTLTVDHTLLGSYWMTSDEKKACVQVLKTLRKFLITEERLAERKAVAESYGVRI